MKTSTCSQRTPHTKCSRVLQEHERSSTKEVSRATRVGLLLLASSLLLFANACLISSIDDFYMALKVKGSIIRKGGYLGPGRGGGVLKFDGEFSKFGTPDQYGNYDIEKTFNTISGKELKVGFIGEKNVGHCAILRYQNDEHFYIKSPQTDSRVKFYIVATIPENLATGSYTINVQCHYIRDVEDGDGVNTNRAFVRINNTHGGKETQGYKLTCDASDQSGIGICSEYTFQSEILRDKFAIQCTQKKSNDHSCPKGSAFGRCIDDKDPSKVQISYTYPTSGRDRNYAKNACVGVGGLDWEDL